MIQELYTWWSQGLESKNVTQYQPGRPIGKKKKKKKKSKQAYLYNHRGQN